MRLYKDSDVFMLMNRNDAISNKIKEAGRGINEKVIVNSKIETMDGFKKTYRESITTLIIQAIEKREILIICPEQDKRLPANIPFIKTNLMSKPVVIVDISRFARINKDDNDNIMSVNIDVDKLYGILVPAYITLKLFTPSTALPAETIKYMSIMWAKMFNKVLIAKRIFVGNSEKYQAFMYFAMRFFMIYYLQCPSPVVDKISLDYIGKCKSKYIQFVEDNLNTKGIDLYQNFTSFARTMFSNEISNIASFNTDGIVIDEKLYLQAFDTYLGKSGAFISLWSAEYFLYCIFVTYNRCWILNDKAFSDIVYDEKTMVPKLMNSLYKEL